MGNAGRNGGEYNTPRPLIRAIVGVVDPRIGETVYDGAVGSAGRVERITISGFSLGEVGVDAMADLWRRGGFPLSFLAAAEEDSLAWRDQFIQSLLERDLPQWGVRVPAVALRRFWTMLAHYHGQTWSAADPARALGVSESG